MKYLILFIMLSLQVIGRERTQAENRGKRSSVEITEEVSLKLKDLKNLPAEDFIQNIDEYREVLSKYIDYKKLVCKGEFSEVVLLGNSLEKKKSKNKKLTSDEKKLCFRELKAIQYIFINNLFLARKRFLEFSYDKKIDELTKTKNKAINSLQDAFSKNEGALKLKKKKRKKN